MVIVYVISSINKNWVYIGMTTDLSERLSRHNNGRERTTRSYAPFKLIHSKIFVDRKDARDYEKFLKIRSNKEKLLKSLN